MKHPIVPRLTSMLAVWLVLVIWSAVAQQVGIAGNLAFLLIISVPVAMSGAERSFCRRHALRAEYLRQGGWLYRLMGNEALVFAVEGVAALLLVAILMIGAVALTIREWSLLLLDVFVLALLMPRVPGLLHDSVKPVYLYALSRRWAVWFSTLLLWLEAMLVLLLGSNDDYRGLTWDQAVAYATAPMAESGSNALASTMLRIDAGADGLACWAAYRLLHGSGGLAQALEAALALAAVSAFWFLLAWGYSRALVGATARPLAIWRPRRGQESGAFETWWQ